MSSVTTAVHPDKETVYYQGSLAQMQSRQFSTINRDNVTFLEIIKNEPRKQSYTDTKEFDTKLSKFPFLSNKFIYKKVIDDARVIPDDIVIKNRMDEYFSPRFYKNIHRLYQNAPLYFDYLFSSEGITEQRHKQYSVYIYTLCLIEYIMKHYTSNDFKLINGHQLYYDWALPKYSEHISYIIKGPLSKSSSIKIDFKKHYASIMNPSNVEGDMTSVLQLASLQNLDTRLTQLFTFLSKMNNAYDKLKDEARTYNLIIRSLHAKCYNEPTLNDTFVVDLRGSDFGNTTDALHGGAKMDTVVTGIADISSRLSIHKLQELFSNYSRFRIVSLTVDSSLYNIPLDGVNTVNVVFQGIQLASRSVTVIGDNNSDPTVNPTNLTTIGTFTHNPINHTYEFTSLVDTNTYDMTKVRVTDARIYLAINGSPIPAVRLSSQLIPTNMYNVSVRHTKGRTTSLPGAVDTVLYMYYGLTDIDRVFLKKDHGFMTHGDIIIYVGEQASKLLSSFINGDVYPYTSKPLNLIYAGGGANAGAFADDTEHIWDGTQEGLTDMENFPPDRNQRESVFAMMRSGSAINGTLPSGTWTEHDMWLSLFSIIVPNDGTYIGSTTAPSIIKSGAIEYTHVLFLHVSSTGIPKGMRVVDINLLDIETDDDPQFEIVNRSTDSVIADLYFKYKSAPEDTTFNSIVITTSIIKGDIVKCLFIHDDYKITTGGALYRELYYTDAWNWYPGVCYLPPEDEIPDMFTTDDEFQYIVLTNNGYDPTTRMLSMSTFVPLLITQDVARNTVIIDDYVNIAGTGDTSIELIDVNGATKLPGTIYHMGSITALKLESDELPNIYYDTSYVCASSFNDVFNMQLEFS